MSRCLNGEALKSAAWKFDQILLQRLDAEGVPDLEVGHLSIWPLRVDEELPVLFEKV